MNFQEHKEKMLENPEFRKAYEALEPEYKKASERIRAKLAKKANKVRSEE